MSNVPFVKAVMGWIYKLTSPSGRGYIGKTTRKAVEVRIKQHCSRTSKCHAIAAAIRKYGIDKFVIEKWQYPDEYLLEYEQLFILDHGTLAPDGYNLKAAGYDNTQVPEVRHKMAEKTRERWTDATIRAQTIESIKAAAAARWERPGQREAASRAAAKRMQDPREREAARRRMQAAWADPAQRDKFLESKHTRWDSDAREKAAASARRKWETRPGYKAQVSTKMKERWADPEFRQRMSEAMTGRTMAPEHRAKIGEIRKRTWDALPEARKAEINKARADGRKRAREARAAAGVL